MTSAPACPRSATSSTSRWFQIQTNHPSGGFFGPRVVGENSRSLLESHPVYIDPVSSLAGGSYIGQLHVLPQAPLESRFQLYDFEEVIAKYKLLPGIGAAQHFCQDFNKLGLTWAGAVY